VAGRDLDQLARRFFGAYRDGDLDSARSLMAEDAVSTGAELALRRARISIIVITRSS
jgi:ketosteroid isomerase-like protein